LVQHPTPAAGLERIRVLIGNRSRRRCRDLQPDGTAGHWTLQIRWHSDGGWL